MDDATVSRYLERIGMSRPSSPTLDALRGLHLAHLRSVPFENLSIHLDEPIALDEASLVDKLLDRRRGGFCYELNGAFALLLGALGFQVTLLSARVLGPDGDGRPFDHLLLQVEVDGIEAPALVDVGFGDHAHFPLSRKVGASQQDPAGEFRVVEAPHGDLDVVRDGTTQYRFESHPRQLGDFAAMCWWQQHSPDSPFTRSPTCSLLTAHGRVTLADRRLIRTVDGVRSESTLRSDHEVLPAYETLFGVVLDRAPMAGPAEGVTTTTSSAAGSSRSRSS